ncbi:hypothetical protein HPB47_019538 [Ixodes persulcatus]|uniref:Uncharacterized protein n=1 Tax=Ixodes persulcatus TaxID=34615 RepID=A0AC60QLF5_IXOPE|nr:hypothetical protein HPB47_019538 [Ixodes persulcatus]
MHPVHHVERRTARAKALRRLLEKEEGVYYTDAARYDRDAMAAAVVDKQGKMVASCSVRTTKPEVAEETASYAVQVTLHHIVWECSRLDRKAQPLLKKIPNQESWEALLLCTDLKVQEQVVRLAEDAAGVQGILAVA